MQLLGLLAQRNPTQIVTPLIRRVTLPQPDLLLKAQWNSALSLELQSDWFVHFLCHWVSSYNSIMRKNPDRLAELRRQMILDSSAEKAYDDITKLLSESLDVPIALIIFMDAERNWSKSRVGFQLAEVPIETSFCESFFKSDKDVIVVPDTLESEQFRQHPLVTGEPQVRFYASARLVVNDQTLGTLCAFDTRPRQLLPEQIDHLKALTLAVVELLQSRTKAQ